jgi:ArsR family transcriptional regulator
MPMRATVAMAKALGDETRLRAVLALRGGELCACHLVELLRLAPSTVSKHMSILRAAGLVESRKQGKWVRYSLASERSSPGVAAAIAWASSAADNAPRVVEDVRKLGAIRAKYPAGLCAGKTCG